MVNKALIPLLITSTLHCAVVVKSWKEVPTDQITEDMEGFFTYDNLLSDNFVLRNTNLTFTNVRATLTINATISGTWNKEEKQACGLIFCSNIRPNNQTGRLTFNPGNLIFHIDSSALVDSKVGFFSLSQGASLDINANFKLTTTPTSNLSSGIFKLDGSASLYVVNSNFIINDLNPFDKNKNLFVLSGKSKAEINHTGNKASQTVLLSGRIALSGDTSLTLDLANPSSFYEGIVFLNGDSSFSFNLSNSSSYIYELKGTKTTTGNRKITLNHSLLGMGSSLSNINLSLSNHSTYQSFGLPQPAQDPTQPIPRSDTIGNIALADSTISLMYDFPSISRLGTPHTQKTLTAGELSGNGTIALYADISTKTTDTTKFADASGKHIIQMYYNPHTFSQTLAQGISEADNMVVSTIASMQSNAIFEGGTTDLGLLSYKTNLISRINNNSIEWLISNITQAGESHLAKALITALNSPYRLFDSSTQMLFTRLGDLRKYPKDHGLYFHYFVGLNLLDTDNSVLKTQETYMNFQGGYDWNFISSSSTNFLGIGFGVDLLDSKNNAYTSSTMGYGFSLSYTSIFTNRFYYDILLNYTYSPSDFDFALPDFHTKTSIGAHLLKLGAELGSKFALFAKTNFFYIEPQIRLVSGVIFPTDLEVTQGQDKIYARSSFDFPLLSKAALYGGYEWNEDFKGDLKLGMFLSYSLANGGDITLKDPRNTLKKHFGWDLDMGLSALGSIEISDFLRFYFELNSSFLGEYTTPINFNVGMRWSFGDRYVPPPPPPPNPERFKVKFKSRTIRDIPTVKRDDIDNMKHYDQYSQPITSPYSSPQAPPPRVQENRNNNRLIPRDTYIPRNQNDTQKGYNRRNQRDSYNPNKMEMKTR